MHVFVQISLLGSLTFRTSLDSPTIAALKLPGPFPSHAVARFHCWLGFHYRCPKQKERILGKSV